jgi:Na+/melibiose symporter-like transporter
MGIQIVFIWLPIFIFLLGIIPMCFYRKYEKNEAQVIREIAY